MNENFRKFLVRLLVLANLQEWRTPADSERTRKAVRKANGMTEELYEQLVAEAAEKPEKG